MFWRKKKDETEDKLPPNQKAIPDILKWGIDHPGITKNLPNIMKDNWRLIIDGEVENPLQLFWKDLQALPQVELISDFHCVEGWSVQDQRWGGVLFRTIIEATKPTKDAKFALFECADGYSTSLPIQELRGDDIILAHRLNGEELSQPLGGPVRLVVPQKYAYKSPMWITKITFSTHDRLGYWERGYYSNSADVWKSERLR